MKLSSIFQRVVATALTVGVLATSVYPAQAQDVNLPPGAVETDQDAVSQDTGGGDSEGSPGESDSTSTSESSQSSRLGRQSSGPSGGSATSRTSVFINLAKGKGFNELDSGEITADEARFLGVFVSNFYIPFHSEFAGNASVTGDEKERKKNNEDIIGQALQEAAGFNEDTSQAFGRWVSSNVWKNSKELKVGVRVEKDSTSPEPSGGVEDTPSRAQSTKDSTLVIGDTFVTAIKSQLEPYADVYGGGTGTSYSHAIEMLKQHINDKQYTHVVFLVGTNSPSLDEEKIRSVKGITGSKKLTFMTVHADLPARKAEFDKHNKAVRDSGAGVIDYASMVKEYPEFLSGNGLYPTSAGATYFAKRLIEQIQSGGTATGGDDNFVSSDAGSKHFKAKELQAKISWPGLLSMMNTYDQDFVDKVRKIGSDGLVYLYYEEGGHQTPVFSFDPSRYKMTPSHVALLQALTLADTNNGHGTALFDLSTAEIELIGTDDKDEETQKKVDDLLNNARANSMFDSTMKVSPFGDIVVGGKNHTYVAIPASLNPGTWIPTLNSIGEPSSTEIPGSTYIGANYQNFLLQGVEKDGIHSPGNIQGPNPRVAYYLEEDKKIFSPNNYKSSDTQKFIGGSGVGAPKNGAKLVSMRAQNGTTIYDLNEYKWRFWKGKKKSELVKSLEDWPSFIAVDGELSMPVWEPSAGDSGKTFHYNRNMYHLTDLGAYEGSDPATSAITQIIQDDGTRLNESFIGSSNLTEFQKTVSMPGDILSAVSKSMPRAAAGSLFGTYLVSSFGSETSKNKLGFMLNPSLPRLSDTNIKGFIGDDPDTEMMERKADITNYLYYLLNPSWDHVAYVAQLITSSVAGFLVRQHSDMTGTQQSDRLSGSSRYIGFAGFVSTPNFHDLQWTDSLQKIYKDWVPYLILLVLVILALYAIMRVVTWSAAVALFSVFTIVALSLLPGINSTINLTNEFSNGIYSKKFTYWALSTHQSYADEIDQAATGGDYQNYLRTLYNNSPAADFDITGEETDTNVNVISNRGGESITLKWQAPKKQFTQIVNEEVEDSASQSETLKKWLNGAVRNGQDAQEFLTDPNSTFLYRSYVDISNASRYTYKGMNNRYSEPKIELNNQPDTSNWPAGLVRSFQVKDEALDNSLKNGYQNPSGVTGGPGTSYLAVEAPVRSKIVSDHLPDKDKLSQLTLGDYVGIPSGAMKGTLAPFLTDTTFKEDLQGKELEGFDPERAGYSDQDYAALSAFALMSESPFYHFSWMLYDLGLSPDAGATDGFRHMVLDPTNQGFFYNSIDRSGEKPVNALDDTPAGEDDTPSTILNEDRSEGTRQQSGELKDYMGMRELFTYTIPYLKASNDVVREYDNYYGFKFYPSLPMSPGHEDDPEIKDNPELRQKYWQNVNVSQLANMHTPWVDLMYDSKYSRPFDVEVQGTKFTITDPLDPATYPLERPMVFSPAEAHDWGLTDKDLTPVEMRIFKVLEKNRNNIVELLNYYTFNDSVLNAAASMMATFTFNQEFSENSWFGFKENIQLYPIGYELKNFSYDAYLRLILSNSLNKELVDSQNDFYLEVTKESSLTTSLMLLVVDVLSIYVFPLLKYFSIIMIFFAALTLLMASVLKSYEGGFFKKLASVVIKPIITFFFITLGFSWLLSLMMGSPANAVTGELGFSLKFGDPVITLMGITALTVIACIMYGKLLWTSAKNTKLYGGAAITSITGAVGMAGSKAANAVGGAVPGVSGIAEGSRVPAGVGVDGRGRSGSSARSGGLGGSRRNQGYQGGPGRGRDGYYGPGYEGQGSVGSRIAGAAQTAKSFSVERMRNFNQKRADRKAAENTQAPESINNIDEKINNPEFKTAGGGKSKTKPGSDRGPKDKPDSEAKE